MNLRKQTNLLHLVSHSSRLINPLLVSPHPLRSTSLQVFETESNVYPLGHNGLQKPKVGGPLQCGPGFSPSMIKSIK